MTPPRTRRVPILIAGLVASAAVLVGAPAPAYAASHAVVIRQYSYTPAALTVAQGDTVTWTNEDTVEHDVTVTSGPATFHSPMLAKGQTWSYTFATAGRYAYVCSVHPDMTAAITVAPRPAPAAGHDHATPGPTVARSPATAQPGAPVTRATVAGPGNRRLRQRHPAPTPSAAAVAAPEATAAVGPVAAPTATLDPLLLVAGASAAVTIFCLLLMTSRPVAAASTTDTENT